MNIHQAIKRGRLKDTKQSSNPMQSTTMAHYDLFHSKEDGSQNFSSLYAMLSSNVTSHNSNHGIRTGEDDGKCDGLHCYPDAVFDTLMVVTIILATFGAVGNILTVLAIITSRLRQNINSILICNLSLADALYCTFLLPIQAMTFHNKAWTLSTIACELHAALRIWLIGVNMLLLSFIGLYRFLHVVHPQQHTRFSQGAWFIFSVIFCWTFPFIFSFMPLVGWWGRFSFQPRILQCTFSKDANPFHKITTITLGYVVPCLFLLVCYIRIGLVVCRSRKRSTRGGSVYRKQRARRDSYRLTGMMVLIFLGFLVGTTPFFLINTFDKKLLYPMPHIWSPILAWVMYGLNPVIYTVMDTQFQRAYRRLLLCQFFKPDLTSDPSFKERNSSVIAGKGVTIHSPIVADTIDKIDNFITVKQADKHSLSNI